MYILRLDYCTMNFERGTVDINMVESSLLGDDVSFHWTRKGLSDTAPVYSPFGVRYMDNNGFYERPHRVDVSGVGCEKFIFTLPRLKAVSEKMGFSRLDFAFDVILSRQEWRDFICKAFASSLNSDRERKRYKLTGDGESMTIYIGSRRGSKFCRIYNKTLEDKEYRYMDSDGNEVEILEDQYVIRYEVELKRYKRDHGRLFDPSPLFDMYYSEDQLQHDVLFKTIRDIWLSFGDSILLPEDFQNAEFVTLFDTKIKILCNDKCVNSDCITDFDLFRVTEQKLHDFPHTFDRTLEWIVDRLGKYIPYILTDQRLVDRCNSACVNAFGFVPEYYLECSFPSGFYDLDDEILIDDPAEDFSIDDDIFVQLEVNFDECKN